MCNIILNCNNNGKKTLSTVNTKHVPKNLIQIVPCCKPLIANASITNWIADQKALVSAFLNMKMLQISLACDLVDLSKFLSKVYLVFLMLVFSGVTGTILLCKRLLIKSAIIINLLYKFKSI